MIIIHVDTGGSVSLCLMAEQLSAVHTSHIFFIHSSVDIYMGWFHVLTIVNSAAMNIGVHIYVWIKVSSGYIPRSGIVGSYGNSNFGSLMNFHTVFHGGCTNFIPTSSIVGFPFLHTLSRICY